MKFRVKHLPWVLTLALIGCEKEKQNSAEIEELRAQIAALAEKPADAEGGEDEAEADESGGSEEQGEEIAKLKAEITALRGATSQIEETHKKLEDALKKNEELEEKVKALEEANQKLQEDLTTRNRKRAIGEKHEQIEAQNGRVFRDVEIRSIDDAGVSITHSAGLATLRHDSAPDEWVTRFGLREKTAPAPEAVAKNDQETAEAEDPSDKDKKILENHFDSIVIIDGNDGTGSGFIMKIAGRNYLYTAAHVICGNTKLTVTNSSGRRFTKFGAFEAADDCDIARIEILEDCESAITLASPNAAKVQEPVLAIGQSGGAGVLTVLEGDVISLGPKEIEVSADVIQGNSGGPLFHGISGDVMGIVTHLVAPREDVWAQDTGFDEIRRFATRLDRDFKWKQMPIGRFIGEKERLEEHVRKTRVLFALSALQPGQQGLRLPGLHGSEQDVLTILAENTDEPAVAKLIEMNRESTTSPATTASEPPWPPNGAPKPARPSKKRSRASTPETGAYHWALIQTFLRVPRVAFRRASCHFADLFRGYCRSFVMGPVCPQFHSPSVSLSAMISRIFPMLAVLS
ncbi:MAG: trypsin-like peptidase domain-containing protein, partial [Akkermansiaceae bacterium]|nr:trypsin-like peptidase domain-containing protein [Akkermansiaceae bacterium]